MNLFRIVKYEHKTLFEEKLTVKTTCLLLEPVVRRDLSTGGTVYNEDGIRQSLFLGGHLEFQIGSIYELKPYEDTKEVQRSVP